MSESNVELEIISVSKLQAKALIFDLLSKSCIEDEDEPSIEYIKNESNKISKCFVSFKRLQS
jgi:hypothetical protein